jgi:methyl-accepting chemotaxis protein
MRRLSFPARLTLLIIGACLTAIFATTWGQSIALRRGLMDAGQASLDHITSTLAQTIGLQARLEEEALTADREIVRTTVDLAGVPVVEVLAEAPIVLEGDKDPTILPAIKLGSAYLHESAPALARAAALVHGRVHFLQRTDKALVRIAGGAPQGADPWPQGSWIDLSSSAGSAILQKQPWTGPVLRDGTWWLATYHPVVDFSEEVLGALEIVRPLLRPEFARFVAGVGVGGAGGSCLMDAEGRLLTPTDPSLAAEVHRLPSDAGSFTDASGQRLLWRRTQDLPWGLQAITWVPEVHLLGNITARILRGALSSLPVPLVLALGLGLLGSHLLLGPVRRMADIARLAAAGDYSRRLDASSRDAMGILAQAMNTLLERLHETFEAIRNAATDVAQSSAALKDNAHQLAQEVDQAVELNHEVSTTTGHMEANLESVAAAMEQATANAQVVSRSLEEAAAHAARMAEDATHSHAGASDALRHAEAATAAARELESASQQIDSIMALIRSIATRTQILALNATIEAQRAGEAGRGFAVVAAEVKTLALQTAQATDEVARALLLLRHGAQGVREHNEQAQEVLHAAQRASASLSQIVAEQAASTQTSATAVSQLFLGLQEISANANRIASLCGDTSHHVETLERSTHHIHQATASVRLQAEHLAQLASGLRALVETNDAPPNEEIPRTPEPQPEDSPSQLHISVPEPETVWLQRTQTPVSV